MQWCRTFTNKGWRVFPISIIDPVLRSLGTKLGNHEPAERVHIDLPGMIMADRSSQTFEFEGLEVEIPTQDYAYMYDQLSRAAVEVLPGGTEVVKMRGWLAGLVLPVSLRQPLLDVMNERLAGARLLGQKEDEEFARRMGEINKKSPVKIISARAEMVKKRGPNKIKPD